MSAPRNLPHLASALAGLLAAGALPAADAPRYASHPPMRPLPTPSARAMGGGPGFFVDPVKGDDTNDGSQAKPWKTLQRAVRPLKPGDTLYLMGGTYYENVYLTQSGTPERPITIRAFPGALPVVDGGLREFFDAPAAAWQPLDGGAEGEYVSTRVYADSGDRKVPGQFISSAWEPLYGIESERPLALGQFGDSMVPLHGYRFLGDLRSTNEFWKPVTKDKTARNNDAAGPTGEGIYCGPGLWYNRDTGRIHVRLAHTRLDGLGDRAYRGETDPRKLPLVVAGGFGEDVFRINGIRHVRIQDIVFRGATGSPLINVYGSDDIEFDGITAYGGFPSLLFNAASRVKVLHSAIRSVAGPWDSRASMKYRGTATYAIIAQDCQPQCRDFEFAWCEFTDGHDFAYLRFIRNCKLHHNLIDGFNDDGIEVGAKKRDQEIYVYQNLLSNLHMNFALHLIDRDESPAEVNPGSGVYVYRNIIDLRGGFYYFPPAKPAPDGAFLHADSNLWNSHGNAVWPNVFFYQNTLISRNPPWRDNYAAGFGTRAAAGNVRAIFNNIFLTLDGLPGRTLAAAPGYQIDGNLHWGIRKGAETQGFLDKFRASKLFEESRKDYPPGWTANDLFADPRFAALAEDWRAPMDLRLRPDSPARQAGVPLPASWPDPLRPSGDVRPDIGALPLGAEPWSVGIHGRIGPFGGPR
jgi:hypothetical protein